jgi:catechol 2,3-dioxygenase-like lactoylglutathione lyase family enzyme
MPLSNVIPAMPVRDCAASAAFYVGRLGFTLGHLEPGMAILQRDGAEVHLWGASDEGWRRRIGFAKRPVRSGAEMAAADVLHPTDAGSAVDTEWGTREFAVLDLEGNLITFFQRR